MRNTFISLLGCLLLVACSGVETIPDDTTAFTTTGFTRYAWRSDPIEQSGYSKSLIYQADPAIRSSFDERMAELGYSRVSRDEAQFLVDYVAAAGMTDGQMAGYGSNVNPYPTAMINRQAGQAEVDNAYALGGVKETGNIALVFVNESSRDVLWKVRISAVTEDANRVNTDALARAVRKGLSTLPQAPGE